MSPMPRSGIPGMVICKRCGRHMGDKLLSCPFCSHRRDRKLTEKAYVRIKK